jgi:DNA primase
LLNDEGARGYGYYRQQIDFTTRSPFARNYGDYFAGRIVFPIRNAASEVIGFIGRRPDNRGIRWLKQQAGETAITTKSWLYGIDKAYRFIKHYRTVILVEGIFDYFAFYRLLQDQGRPVVVSTLGSYLSAEAMDIFKSLGWSTSSLPMTGTRPAGKAISRSRQRSAARCITWAGCNQARTQRKS